VFLIQILTVPIISRLYTPEQYGEYAVFNLLYLNLSTLALLALPEALILTRNEKQFKAIAQIILISSITVSILVLTASLLYGDHILSLISGIDYVPWWLHIVPFMILLPAFQAIYSNWLTKEKKFSINVSSNITSKLLSRSSVIGMGFIHMLNQFGLIAGELIQIIISISSRYWMDRRKNKPNLLRILRTTPVNKKFTLETLRKFSNFPIFIFPGRYVNLLSQQLPIIYISVFFIPSDLGSYTFSNSIINLPVQLLGMAVNPVFFQNTSERYLERPETLKNFTWKTILLLMLIGIIPFLTIIFFGEEIFDYIFGDEWSMAGQLASILAIGAFFQYLVYPINSHFLTLSREKLLFKIQIVQLFVRSMILFMSYLLKLSLIDMLWIFTLGNVILYLIQIIIIFSILGNPK